MKKYTIRPLMTGHIPNYPKQYYYHHSTHKFYPDVKDEIVFTPCFCFLLEGDGFKALVDTGMCWAQRASDYHHHGSVQNPGEAVYEQLEALGIGLDEIKYIVFTHLHWDHIFHMEKFPKATYIAHKKEYAFAMKPIPLYYKSYEYPQIGVVRPFEGLKIETVEGDIELFDGIRVFETPGHSPGHMAVEVDTWDGAYVIGGDAAFIMDNFKPIPEIGYEITPPSRFADIVECWESIVRIKKRATGLEQILLTHDVHLEERIKAEPVLGLPKK